MKLHANAALSLNQRPRMVRRVVDERWSLTEPAAAPPDPANEFAPTGPAQPSSSPPAPTPAPQGAASALPAEAAPVGLLQLGRRRVRAVTSYATLSSPRPVG